MKGFALVAAAALIPVMAGAAQQPPAPAPAPVRPAQPALAGRVERRALQEADRAIQEAYDTVQRLRLEALDTDLFLGALADGGAASARVNPDLENATVRDALKQLFEQARHDYRVDEDVPEDARVTLKAKNLRLSTALNVVTDAAGAGWTVESTRTLTVKPGEPPQTKASFRIGKKLRTGYAYYVGPHPMIAEPLRNALFWVGSRREERSTFTCPHCKGQSTLIRERSQPKCPKCNRTFEEGWQFCPLDGSKRPAPPAEWRFCPHCGKEVKPGRSSGAEPVSPPASLPAVSD